MAHPEISIRLLAWSQRNVRVVVILTRMRRRATRCGDMSRRPAWPSGCWPYGRPCYRLWRESSDSASRRRTTLPPKADVQVQSGCAEPDHHGRHNHGLARGACPAQRDRATLPQRPRQTQATGREEVRAEMRQIADHQRGQHGAAETSPAEQQAANDNGDNGVGQAAMPDSRGQRP